AGHDDHQNGGGQHQFQNPGDFQKQGVGIFHGNLLLWENVWIQFIRNPAAVKARLAQRQDLGYTISICESIPGGNPMKLMAIDGNSIINRAYYGIRPLTTRDGLYTHAVFGFLTTLLRLREEEKPDAVCVTFDVHAPTFRHTADEAYKATRKPMPEELRMQ